MWCKQLSSTIIPLVLQWNNSPVSPNGEFPRYYRENGMERVAVAASEVPDKLREAKLQTSCKQKKLLLSCNRFLGEVPDR